jgi:DNA-binding MarR family transcriptional regulator
MVSRRMIRELNQRLQPSGVTAAQFVVLAVPWERDGLAQNVIADLIGSDRPTLTAMLKLMTAQGLVRRDGVLAAGTPRRGCGPRPWWRAPCPARTHRCSAR